MRRGPGYTLIALALLMTGGGSPVQADAGNLGYPILFIADE